jgi:hypothetical protein
MTQDEIIEMAKEAGFPIFGTKVVANDPMQQMLADAVTQHYHDSAIQFAKLVAAKEREACVDVVETHCIPVGNSAAGEMACEWTYEALKEIAAAIRARGEA